MAKLLETQLPLESGQTVRPETFNRAIRLLDLNLNKFDTNATPSFLVSTRDTGKFTKGDVIWNLDESVLQVWLGNRWENLSTPSTSGLSATATLGKIQVIASGNITVEIS